MRKKKYFMFSDHEEEVNLPEDEEEVNLPESLPKVLWLWIHPGEECSPLGNIYVMAYFAPRGLWQFQSKTFKPTYSGIALKIKKFSLHQYLVEH